MTWTSSRRTTAKFSGLKVCLRAFWDERALPSGVRGPVECCALARLVAVRSAFGMLGSSPTGLASGVGVGWGCGWVGVEGKGNRVGRFLRLLSGQSGKGQSGIPMRLGDLTRIYLWKRHDWLGESAESSSVHHITGRMGISHEESVILVWRPTSGWNR